MSPKRRRAGSKLKPAANRRSLHTVYRPSAYVNQEKYLYPSVFTLLRLCNCLSVLLNGSLPQCVGVGGEGCKPQYPKKTANSQPKNRCHIRGETDRPVQGSNRAPGLQHRSLVRRLNHLNYWSPRARVYLCVWWVGE